MELIASGSSFLFHVFIFFWNLRWIGQNSYVKSDFFWFFFILNKFSLSHFHKNGIHCIIDSFHCLGKAFLQFWLNTSPCLILTSWRGALTSHCCVVGFVLFVCFYFPTLFCFVIIIEIELLGKAQKCHVCAVYTKSGVCQKRLKFWHSSELNCSTYLCNYCCCVEGEEGNVGLLTLQWQG